METPLTLTIVQLLGREQFEWTVIKRGDLLWFEKVQHAPSMQIEMSRKFLWRPESMEFVKFVKCYIMRILLENGALDNYKSQIILHSNKDMHPEGRMTEFDDIENNDSNFSKNDFARNIVVSNAWYKETYEEYFDHKREMESAVEDMVNMFIYTNTI
jgi:hypothetical protein